MYYIADLPKNLTLVFVYGKRLTSKKQERIEQLFLEYCKEHFPEISSESYTKEAIKNTIYCYFSKYKQFEQDGSGYRTENSYSSHRDLTVIEL